MSAQSSRRPRSLRILRGAGWFVLVSVVVVFGLKTLVGDVYRISSPSMEPTLMTGEWVLVRFDRSPPERGDIVVVRQRGELLVKRVLGLGNESLQIVDGDVWVDGGPLPPSRRGFHPVWLFEQGPDLDSHFDHGSTRLDPWSVDEASGHWRLDAREVERGSQAGLLRLRPEVGTDQPLPVSAEGRLGARRDVGDIVVSCELRVDAAEADGCLRVCLIEQGDRFTLSIEVADGPDRGRFELTRRDKDGLDRLAEGRFELPAGDWFPLRFQNVDDHLLAEVAGSAPVVVATGPNSLHPLDHGKLGVSIGNRVLLGGEACVLELRRLRIGRDHHYELVGDFGVERELVLGSDELFLLGDNSMASRDSRTWGAVRRSDLEGRAARVVWPLSSWRRP